MNTTLSEVSRWDVTPIFWEADDFCRTFAQQSRHHPQLPLIRGERLCQSKLSRSEVMTMVIAFQGSGYRPFKEFSPLGVLPRVPPPSELQPLRGTDALVPDAALWLSLYPHWRNDRSCFHQFPPD